MQNHDLARWYGDIQFHINDLTNHVEESVRLLEEREQECKEGEQKVECRNQSITELEGVALHTVVKEAEEEVTAVVSWEEEKENMVKRVSEVEAALYQEGKVKEENDGKEVVNRTMMEEGETAQKMNEELGQHRVTVAEEIDQAQADRHNLILPCQDHR